MVWSDFEVTELTWENGQLAMHELGGIFPPSPKPVWGGCDGGGGGVRDTLESIVHQATYYNQKGHNMENVGSVVASCGGKWAEKSGPLQKSSPTPPPPPPGLIGKRTRSGFESACASANVFSKEFNETTMMTWSNESPRSSIRTKTTHDDDSACHDGSEFHEEERETKGETRRSYPTRKGRAAAVHNQSERRRRDRINQKMKALQKLVPNSSKTDKASMLDEVIEYLKQLQAQVQMINQSRFMPQLMMPLGIQQHLHQISLLAKKGMGMNPGLGMGMTETPPSVTQTIPSTYFPPAFGVPQMIAPSQAQLASYDPRSGGSGHFQDAYNTLLAQSMNIELYNRITAFQRQQQQTASGQANNQSLHPNHHLQRSSDRSL